MAFIIDDILLATAAVVGTGAQINQARKAGKAAEEQNDIAIARSNVERSRNIRRAVAQSRVQQAETVAQAQATGASESSGTAGALAQEIGGTGGNIGFAQQIGGFQTSMFKSRAAEQRYTSRASQYGAGAKILSNAAGFNNPGEFLGSLFGN